MVQYTALITEIRLAGTEAIISLATPNPANEKEMALTMSLVIPRDEATRLMLMDKLEVIVNRTGSPNEGDEKTLAQTTGE